ncbi:uncharacterized protein LOC144339216 [Macaca mulatta]
MGGHSAWQREDDRDMGKREGAAMRGNINRRQAARDGKQVTGLLEINTWALRRTVEKTSAEVLEDSSRARKERCLDTPVRTPHNSRARGALGHKDLELSASWC